jgi:hypothetical protein
VVDGVDEAHRPGNGVQCDVLRSGLAGNEQAAIATAVLVMARHLSLARFSQRMGSGDWHRDPLRVRAPQRCASRNAGGWAIRAPPRAPAARRSLASCAGAVSPLLVVPTIGRFNHKPAPLGVHAATQTSNPFNSRRGPAINHDLRPKLYSGNTF